MRFLSSILVMAVLLTGCASFEVVTSKGKETGIPFYKPEPYLLVQFGPPEAPKPPPVAKPAPAPAGTTGTTAGTTGTTTAASPAAAAPVKVTNPLENIRFEILYLPAKEPSGYIKPLGDRKSVGQVLKSINGKTDAQVDELITSIGSLIPNLGKLFSIGSFDKLPQEEKASLSADPKFESLMSKIVESKTVLFKIDVSDASLALRPVQIP